MSADAHDDDITMWMSVTQYIASDVHKYSRISNYSRAYHRQGVSHSIRQDSVNIHPENAPSDRIHQRANPPCMDVQRKLSTRFASPVNPKHSDPNFKKSQDQSTIAASPTSSSSPSLPHQPTPHTPSHSHPVPPSSQQPPSSSPQ